MLSNIVTRYPAWGLRYYFLSVSIKFDTRESMLQCDYSKQASLKKINTNQKLSKFHERSALCWTSVCMLQCDWSVYEKGRHLLFSINVLIGYFSSNWPASSSRTVTKPPGTGVLYHPRSKSLRFIWSRDRGKNEGLWERE